MASKTITHLLGQLADAEAEITAIREQLANAERIRDEARAASNRDLETKRKAEVDLAACLRCLDEAEGRITELTKVLIGYEIQMATIVADHRDRIAVVEQRLGLEQES